MAYRERQKVVYTSPIKALSNQKYRELNEEFKSVGLMTGDVMVNPKATCLVVTTEILRAWLTSNTDMNEIGWVIFDEIHYMEHQERGIVWEECLILMPSNINLLFLSATISNGSEFARWICSLHKRPCHVVYTNFRPTPLNHYVFPASGGSEFQLIVDEDGEFRETDFQKLLDSVLIATCGPVSKTDVHTVIEIIREREFLPGIIFCFSRKECEDYLQSSIHLDLNDKKEEAEVDLMVCNAIETLNLKDRQLPDVQSLLPFLRKGIAMQHSGLLPMIRELVEILFEKGLVKVLFATETFFMGVNMPAKSVVFTSVKKWDGENRRYVRSGEYKQMSGRAGRRGKDVNGMSVIMIDETVEMCAIKEMDSGKPAPLISTFRLSYQTIIKLLRRMDTAIVFTVLPKYLDSRLFFAFPDCLFLRLNRPVPAPPPLTCGRARGQPRRLQPLLPPARGTAQQPAPTPRVGGPAAVALLLRCARREQLAAPHCPSGRDREG